LISTGIASEPKRPRLLILNWRDPHHPKAGGAETLTFEWAQGWRTAGLEVTWFANEFPGSVPEIWQDGIRIVRRGGPYTQSLHARKFDRREGPFDLVVEEINTLPFLSCLWAIGRSVLLMHQLAREVWFYEAPWGLSWLGYLAEPLYLRLYRRQPAMVLSPSTRTDLEHLGFDTNRIGLLAGASDAVVDAALPRPRRTSGDFSYIYVGRLAASKRVHDIIAAFATASRVLGLQGIRIRLWIVGTGLPSYERRLRSLVQRLDLGETVQFRGWVNKWWLDDKLSSCDVLVMASVREGWGLVVTEANSIGIPAIGYPVHGLRDSIQHGITGLVSTAQNPTSLSREMVKLASSPDLLDRLAEASLKDAALRDWSSSRRRAVEALARAASQLGGRGDGDGQSATSGHSNPVKTLLQGLVAKTESVQAP
jgi:glycosyltransferase involved in cell wall biosynthesis